MILKSLKFLLKGGRCDYNPRAQKGPNYSTEYGTHINRSVSNFFLFLLFIALFQPTLPKILLSAYHICCPNNTKSTGPCVFADTSARHSITLSKPHHAVPPSLCVTDTVNPPTLRVLYFPAGEVQ